MEVDDGSIEIDLKKSQDEKLVIIKITAPHELNNQDIAWALEWYADKLTKAEEIKRMCQGEA